MRTRYLVAAALILGAYLSLLLTILAETHAH